MAAPRADSYSGASGADLVVGRDVVNGVWTPSKDGSGNILASSVAATPLNQWVQVAGTALTAIRSALLALSPSYDITSATDNKGSGRDVMTTLNAWVGCCVDEANGIVYIGPGGGHNDSSTNGIWALDLLKMQWRVEAPPLKPSDSLSPWSAEYLANAGGGGWTQYRPSATAPADEVTFDWPDFIPLAADGLPRAPTSRHTYNGCYFDTARGDIVSTRISLWRWNVVTKTWSRQRPIIAGAPEPIDVDGGGQAVYHAASDRAIGTFARHRTFVSKPDELAYFNGTNPTRVNLSQSVGSPVSNNNHAWVRIDADTVLAVGNGSGGSLVYGYLNLATLSRPQAAAPVSGGVQSVADMPALFYEPENNKVVRRLTGSGVNGNWREINLSTMTESAHTPAGNVPPMGTYPGNKYFSFPAWKGVIAIAPTNDTTPCVYFKRTG